MPETTGHTESPAPADDRADRPDRRAGTPGGSLGPAPGTTRSNPSTRPARRAPSPASAGRPTTTPASAAPPRRSPTASRPAHTSVDHRWPAPRPPCHGQCRAGVRWPAATNPRCDEDAGSTPSLPRRSPIQSDWVAYFSTVATGRTFNRRQQLELRHREWRGRML